MVESGRQRVKEVFDAARRMPPGERAAFVRAECGPDDRLRSHVNELLDDLEAAGKFLHAPTQDGPGAPVPSDAERPGAVIGRYRLLEQIGEGGFGSVYMAEQTEPVTRRVALKIIKLGMDTRAVIARFEAERQALAMMDHPNIAKVLDAGATETGRPYFVMELVKGVPITRFCDEERLALRERLTLFIDACHAVQHAHQKGIIHRDLKPSNVLVSRYDDTPVVKIIDFGIAKATGGNAGLTDKTLFTEFRQLIGTPAYMSPEQAGLSDLDIDTRSDIYALGVLLYELLTGATPFDAERLRSAGFDEMRRIIREEEPPRPSTRLSSMGTSRLSPPSIAGLTEGSTGAGGPAEPAHAALSSVQGAGESRGWGLPDSGASVARRRRTDPRSLVRSLHGDLDWIVMRSLEKDRTRRYDTAAGLAQDIERYIGHEPVLAGPPSRLYRVRKFVRRNRGMVTAAALVGVALLAGIAGTSYGLVRAEGRRAEAEAAREQTQKVADFQATMLSGIDPEAMGRGFRERFREQVRAALTREHVGEGAQRRPRTDEEVEAALATFDHLAGPAGAVDVARGVMDEFILARAAEALEEQFADQPLVQSQLHFALGRTYRDLGLYDAAEPHLRVALELRQSHYGPAVVHPDLADCLYSLAALMDDLGRSGEAEALYREALTMRRQLGDSALVARTLEAIAGGPLRQRALTEAEPMLEEALRLHREVYGEDHEHFIHNLATLSALRFTQGRLDEAEALNRRVLAWYREHYGEQHERVAFVKCNLSQTLTAQGRHQEAEELLREALAIHLAVLGEVHPRVAKDRFQLGREIIHQGRRREGEDLYRQALAQQRALLGDDHPEVRVTLRDLADSRMQDGDFDEAVSLLREALAIAQQVYPEGDPQAFRRFSTMMALGATLNRQARALLETDRERALALAEEGEALTRAGFVGRSESPPNREDLESKRRAAESYVKSMEFWHSADPDGGWDARAAMWRTVLEKIPEP